METICITKYDTVRIIPHNTRLFLFLEKYDDDFIYLIKLEKGDEFFSLNLNKPITVIDIDNAVSTTIHVPSICQRITSYYTNQQDVEDNLYNHLIHIEGVFEYITKINKNNLQNDTPGTYLSTHNCSVIYQGNVGKILVHEVIQSLNESCLNSKSYPSKYDRFYEDMFEIELPLKSQFMPVYYALQNPIDPVIIKQNF